jgi:predicted component of type VI protein secretion system
MPKLIVIAGPHKGEEFPLNGTRVLAGRDLNNGIYLPDGLVSRHHAEIVREGDEYHLRDLQSTNGSFVNDEPVTETVLHDGDIIRLADVVLRYEAGPVTARPAAPASLKIRPATSSAPLAEPVAPLATRPILKIEPAPAPAKPVVLKNESAASPPPPPAREAPRPAVPAPAAESNRGSAPLSPPRPAAPVEEQEVVFLERPRRKLAPFVILLVVGVLALIAGYTLEANALRFWGLLFLAVGLLGLVHDWTPLPPKPKTP